MKYLSTVCTLIFILAFLCSFAFGETSPIAKGRKILDGSFAMSSSGGDLYEDLNGDRGASINGAVSGGYFLIPNLAVGAKFSLARDSYGDSSSAYWGIGPQLSYFIGSPEPKDDFQGVVYPFLSVCFLYSRDTAKMKILEETETFTDSLITIGLGGGICVMVSDTVGFVIRTDYEIDRLSPDEGDSISGNEIVLRAGIAAFGY